MADLKQLFEARDASEPGSPEEHQAAEAILEKIFEVEHEYPMNGPCC
jgi:hypothetical protein